MFHSDRQTREIHVNTIRVKRMNTVLPPGAYRLRFVTEIIKYISQGAFSNIVFAGIVLEKSLRIIE